jgi:drug/metabolite transporter (DMT)-like permease
VIQIWTASLLSGLYVLASRPPLAISPAALYAILATGLLATSAAYLIQTSVQKFTEATHAALILALEPVFALLTAYFWAGEVLSLKGAAGALLMFAGMMVAEFSPLGRISTWIGAAGD